MILAIGLACGVWISKGMRMDMVGRRRVRGKRMLVLGMEYGMGVEGDG